MATTVGTKLREARGEMTRFELAVKSGVSTNAIFRAETGKVQPRIETVRLLADALGVTLSDLLDEDAA
jgi:transcriptional regulator with XRE-family HTH domain